MFPYCIGVSAGITDGFSYVSRQSGRNLEILKQYRHDKRYVSVRNFLKCRSLFGLQFAFEEIPNQLIPFDWDTFHQYNGTYLVGVTNGRTGQAEYLDGTKLDKANTMVKATCAFLWFFRPFIWMGRNTLTEGFVTPFRCVRRWLTATRKC